MTAGLWFAAGAMALARFAYPRLLERRHEARFVRGSNGIVVGAEPIDLPRPGAPAALLLHGGGDAPQSMRGLAEYLHARGYAVRAPLLENHGRALEETRRFSADRWHAQVRGELEALRAKHTRVALVGQSVGGALALDLAAEHSGVSAMVLLAPWIAMSEPILSVARLSRVWGPLFPYLPSLGGHSIHDTAARARALTQ
jgi:carboxylesterase